MDSFNYTQPLEVHDADIVANNNPDLFNIPSLDLGHIFNSLFSLFRKILDFIFSIYSNQTFQIIFFILIVFFVSIITYCTIRLFEIRKKEHHHLHEEIEEYAHKQAEKLNASTDKVSGVRNERWMHVLNYLSSENPSDWRLAIMESDSMLEDLTDRLEFEGENLGERLKSVNRDKFKTLDDAWEAHIVRNRIAHEGLRYEITKHEANRVVMLYENVFREFGYI
ncbi:hypothetical protein K8Q94_01785 [Candidatus Nomurabacteria bacterium]|nr:hypothetical protein [Candidatus Nomurabacteria bacterium]